MLTDLGEFSRLLYPGRVLRSYQLEAALPILSAILEGRGGSYTIMFSRQAGKDELLAQLEAFLLARYRIRGGNLVVGAPTFKPQCMVSKRRLLELCGTPLHPGVQPSEGYRVVCGQAGVSFLTTEPAANQRGETASIALAANEAQDIGTEIWDPRFAPMAASTNAPSLFSGTPWTSDSLLAREARHSEGEGTLFKADWARVAAEVPAYGEHVRERMARLGYDHPFIKTEYRLMEMDAEGGLFPRQKQEMMRGQHERRRWPETRRQYAFLLDVAGSSEDQTGEVADRGKEKRRDSTFLTVVEVDTATCKDPVVARPVYRVVDRYMWTDVAHARLYSALLDLARERWRPRWVVVDSTGVGAGLAGFIGQALKPPRYEVIPFLFSLRSKSDLGWGFLGVVDSGRFKDYLDDYEEETNLFWHAVRQCDYTVDPGPGHTMRWRVPEKMGHDDALMSAALCAVLDELDWRPRTVTGRTRQDAL